MIRRERSETVIALVAILAAAVNLRIGVTAVGPLLDRIRADTGMSATVAGILGSIPFACMGLFAPVGLRLLLRVPARRLVAGCLVLIIAGTLVRAAAPTSWQIVAATLPIGVGIAIVGVALPGVIKSHFPARTGAAMGGYVGVLSVGAAVAALTMVPLANALGGWRAAFAVSVIPTLVCLPLWLLLPPAREVRAEPPSTKPLTVSALGVRRILLLAGVFGLQSVCFAAVTNWVAALYHHAGWTSSAAGFTTALVSILVIPGAMVIPALSDRGDRRNWVVACAVVMSVGMFGLALAPTAAPWLWIVAFGIGDGALFALALTLPQDLSGDQRTRAVLTTWMLGLGYALSGLGPLIVGGLLDLTGGFVVPMVLLGAVGIFSGVCALAPSLRRPMAEPALAPARAAGQAFPSR